MDPHIEKSNLKKNPLETANLLSRTFFIYSLKIIWEGFKKKFEENCNYQVTPDSDAKKLGDRFEKEWRKNKSFSRTLWTLFGKTYIVHGFLLLILLGIHVIRPILIGKYIAYFTPNQKIFTRKDALIFCITLIVINYLDCFIHHQYVLLVKLLAIKARTAVNSFLYRNCLYLKEEDLQDSSPGKFLTLISIDAASFPLIVNLFNYIWIGVLKFVIISIILYFEVGTTALVFPGVFITIIPLQIWFFVFTTKFRLEASAKSDWRFRIVRETLSSIRTVKMNILEKFFEKKIHQFRKIEVGLMYKTNFALVANTALSALNQHLVFFLMVLTYGWLGNILNPQKTYFMLTCFQSVYFELNVVFPYGISHFSTFWASLKRLEKTAETMQNIQVPTTRSFTTNPRIKMKSFTIKNRDTVVLKDISLELGPGLTLLSGSTGSGKTIFLKSLLGEEHSSNSLEVLGRISYASQDPWIFPSTIRQNIIFSQKFNAKRYSKVVKLCALDQDFQLLQNGDLTIVADRAINLSKGQQARINLARAVYKNSEIYLLDDCFSSLDPGVSKFVFEECLVKFLKEKIVILVSNNISLQAMAERILFIHNYRVELREHSKCKLPNNLEEPKITRKMQEVEEICDYESGDEKTILLEESSKPKQIYYEKQQTGGVKVAVYKKYIQAGGGFIFFTFICSLFVFDQLIISYKGKFISNWVNFEVAFSQNRSSNVSTRKILHCEHGFLVTVLAIATFARVFVNFIMTKKASLNIHKNMNRAVLNAPMSFFDSIFLGNILNRYSKDFQVIDYSFPFVLSQVLSIFCDFVGVIVVIAMVNVTFLIPSSIFIIILILFRNFYLQTSRHIKRLGAATLSPVVGHMSSTLEGLATIRANNAEDLLKNEFDKYQNTYTSVSYLDEFCSRFFIFYIDIFCMTFIASVIIRFFITSDDVKVGGVGLAIYQAITLMMRLQWGIFQWSELENQMISVERVAEYAEVKSENRQGLHIENWPKQGLIVYKNLYLGYSDDDFVLKNINFTVNPGEKVAIVGRTGAGKSSIISSLFRLYDYKGFITIDGIDIKTLSLDCLRSSIAVIPQDPVLFTGTIRENLDPLGRYSDDEIWKSLGKTGLKAQIQSLGLDVGENGMEFSVGQRQLLCLAMVLLKKSKIVVFDEAVENVDRNIELALRNVISAMDFCTLITVAHKLDFVMDFHRVIVLENGEIVENDSPKNLLNNTEGVFYDMANKFTNILG